MRRAVAWKREQPYLALVPPPLSAAKTYSSSATGALGGLLGVAAGTETFSGTASGRLGALRGVAAGTETFSGTASGRLGALRGVAVGTEKFSGTTSGHLGLLHGVAAATYTGPGLVATAAGRLLHLAGNARGVFSPDRRGEANSYWRTRGLKAGDVVYDKAGRRGIVGCNKNGPYVTITSKGFYGTTKLSDWKKA